MFCRSGDSPRFTTKPLHFSILPLADHIRRVLTPRLHSLGVGAAWCLTLDAFRLIFFLFTYPPHLFLSILYSPFSIHLPLLTPIYFYLFLPLFLFDLSSYYFSPRLRSACAPASYSSIIANADILSFYRDETAAKTNATLTPDSSSSSSGIASNSAPKSVCTAFRIIFFPFRPLHYTRYTFQCPMIFFTFPYIPYIPIHSPSIPIQSHIN